MSKNSDGFEMRNITQVGSGDYVKVGYKHYEKIASVSGVGANGSLAKPSQGGFSVTTESGRHIGMTQARSYHKASDIEKS